MSVQRGMTSMTVAFGQVAKRFTYTERQWLHTLRHRTLAARLVRSVGRDEEAEGL
jgi:hypothetical protein